MKKLIYVRTVEELNIAGVPRLRALPGQGFDTTKDIQSPVNVRINNPIGTVFAVRSLIENIPPWSNNKYYVVDPPNEVYRVFCNFRPKTNKL